MNINFPTSHHLEHVALLASQLKGPLSSHGPPHSLLCDVDILRHFRVHGFVAISCLFGARA